MTGSSADEQRFLGLRDDGPGRWTFEVERRLTAPPGWLYGGAAIAAATTTMAAATGRPPIWVTTQFLANADLGATVEIEVVVEVAARRTSHARTIATVAGREVFTAVGAFGEGKPDGVSGQWVPAPEAPPPAESEPMDPPAIPQLTESCLGTMERRIAFGPRPGSGEVAPGGRLGLWTRVTGQDSTSPAMLAWLADSVPMSIAVARGDMPMGTSLDNTIRLARRAPSDWVLLDMYALGADRGYGYALGHLWTEDGVLLGTASQTAVLRPLPPGTPIPFGSG